jgi:hydroxymethylpyrimidine/phosphomethylpyrimidine kinase
MNEAKIPVVMSIAGNDPTGGAGLQADIEAISSMGCHAAPVVAALTVQDTANVQAVMPVGADVVIQQARAVLEDMPVDVIKLGLLGSVEVIEAVHTLLVDYPDLPVVLDPVLAAGGGRDLSDETIIDAMRTLLVPLATVITPNSLEARRLAQGSDNLDAAAIALLDMGAEFVLVTGAHENTPDVHNVLYANNRKLETFTWDRLDGSYHGSGCTLASAIAGLLAQGQQPLTAMHEAQEYTWQALSHGYRIGMGQLLPNRLFWAEAEEE